MEIEVLANMDESYNKVYTKRNVTEIVQKYSSRLKSFIRKRVSNMDDADDILQDVFYQLAEMERLTKPIDQMTAWLYTVARNRIVDWYRKKRTEPLPYLADEDELNLADEINEQIFDNGDSPETEYLKSLIWTELYESLEQLPAEQKSVFELTEIKGLSFKEISDQTGLPVNTLISRKHYAVLFLRERLQLLYDELLNF